MTHIFETKEYRIDYHQAVQHLLNQLTTEKVILTEADFRQLLASENSHLFLLTKDNVLAGMLTIGTYYSPTGKKAWIEDVVVDEKYRGKGYGKLLVEHAIQFVKAQRIPLLMLTSNPKRIIANKLYPQMGFERKETNVYRMKQRFTSDNSMLYE